tara:strand:- start:445 stop:654 length:210 start_codon:yes stop_codon:yes gene_type:complete
MKKLTTSPKDSNYDPDTDPTNIAMTKALEKHYAAADAAEEEDEDIDENGNVITSREEYDAYIERISQNN